MTYKTMYVSENNNNTLLIIQFYIVEGIGNSTFGFENNHFHKITIQSYIKCILFVFIIVLYVRVLHFYL